MCDELSRLYAQSDNGLGRPVIRLERTKAGWVASAVYPSAPTGTTIYNMPFECSGEAMDAVGVLSRKLEENLDKEAQASEDRARKMRAVAASIRAMMSNLW